MIRLWHRCGTAIHITQGATGPSKAALFSDPRTDDALTHCPGCAADLQQAHAASEFTCTPPAPRVRRYLNVGMRTAA